MSSITTMFLSTLAELGLAVALLAVFLRSKDMRQRFSALVVYFFLRVVEGICSNLLFLTYYFKKYPFLPLSQHQIYAIYFFTFWGLFLISAVAIFATMLQLYSAAMSPLAGLKDLGRRVFYWAGGVCVLMAVTAGIVPLKFQIRPGLLVDTARALMRCVSVLEICLLMILFLTVTKLGLGFKSRIFGISFGMGVLSFQYLVYSVIATRQSGLHSALSIANEVVQILCMGIWLVYGLRAEPSRKPIMLPVTSPLIRWNEIALALGFGEAKIAVGGSPSSFVIPEVERAVDKVMMNNSIKKSVEQVS